MAGLGLLIVEIACGGGSTFLSLKSFCNCINARSSTSTMAMASTSLRRRASFVLLNGETRASSCFASSLDMSLLGEGVVLPADAPLAFVVLMTWVF